MIEFNLDLYMNLVVAILLGGVLLFAIIRSFINSIWRRELLRSNPGIAQYPRAITDIRRKIISPLSPNKKIFQFLTPAIPALLIIIIGVGYFLYQSDTSAKTIATSTSTNRLAASADNQTCSRKTPYDMPPEFSRAISLLEQRTAQYIEKTYSLKSTDLDSQFDELFVEQSAKNGGADSGTDPNIVLNYGLRKLKNCLDVNYAPNSEAMKNVEGFFVLSKSGNSNDLVIRVSPRYNQTDDLLTSFLLAHEISHAINYSANLNSQNSTTKTDCFNDETWAYTTQLFFLTATNNEELNSINSRLKVGQTAELSFLRGLIESIMMNNSDGWSGWSDIRSKVNKFVTGNPTYQQLCQVYPDAS